MKLYLEKRGFIQAERNDNKIDDRLNKSTVIERKRRFCYFTCLIQLFGTKENGKMVEIRAAGKQTDQRADDIGNQRGYDLTERAAYDYADRHIDNVAL